MVLTLSLTFFFLQITEHGITLPLKGKPVSVFWRFSSDGSAQVLNLVSPAGAEEGEVVVVASQLRGYGVWDGSLAGDGTLLAGWGGPAPSLLLLWVSDAQANLLKMELSSIQTSAALPGNLGQTRTRTRFCPHTRWFLKK